MFKVNDKVQNRHNGNIGVVVFVWPGCNPVVKVLWENEGEAQVACVLDITKVG